MKRYLITLLIFLLPAVGLSAQTLGHSQWEGRKVAFLGDSITDADKLKRQTTSIGTSLPRCWALSLMSMASAATE